MQLNCWWWRRGRDCVWMTMMNLLLKLFNSYMASIDHLKIVLQNRAFIDIRNLFGTIYSACGANKKRLNILRRLFCDAKFMNERSTDWKKSNFIELLATGFDRVHVTFRFFNEHEHDMNCNVQHQYMRTVHMQSAHESTWNLLLLHTMILIEWVFSSLFLSFVFNTHKKSVFFAARVIIVRKEIKCDADRKKEKETIQTVRLNRCRHKIDDD